MAQALPPSIAALINAAAIRFGVRPAFARAVAWVESRGSQTAVSQAGAIGVMQLMPATARGLGVDPYELHQNVEGGVRLLASHLANFSEALTAAAYNAGVKALYQDPTEWPAETRKYVPAVMARAALEEGLGAGPYVQQPADRVSIGGFAAIGVAGALAALYALSLAKGRAS